MAIHDSEVETLVDLVEQLRQMGATEIEYAGLRVVFNASTVPHSPVDLTNDEHRPHAKPSLRDLMKQQFGDLTFPGSSA